MQVPLLDLKNQYRPLTTEILEATRRVVESGNFVLSNDVKSLEAECADYLRCRHTLGVSSGTDALWLALRAVGIKAGDKVLTSPFTFFATVSAICAVGAEPVFADILPGTFLLDPALAEEALKKDPTIRAILPVHLYGKPADMKAFKRLGEQYGCAVIEDAAQAIGTTLNGERVGALGDIGCFSFFPTKNLGCLGDGGLVATNNDALAERLQLLRVHGSKVKYHHELLGNNCRLDSLQAAYLRIFLPQLEKWIAARRKIAAFYSDKLSTTTFLRTPETDLNSDTFHQYTISVIDGDRDGLKDYLAKCGVATAVYYPIPCHLQPALSHLGYKPGSFPQSERASYQVLSLPIFPGMTEEQQAYVVESILSWQS